MELRCVIVDDDPRFIGAARVLLERDGMRVAGAAGSCAEAVERVAAVRPDVVLIDIRLGEQSGFEVASRLAGGGEGAVLVMISTHSWADYADLVAASPAAGFVAKAELSADAIRSVLAPG